MLMVDLVAVLYSYMGVRQHFQLLLHLNCLSDQRISSPAEVSLSKTLNLNLVSGGAVV